MAAKQRTELTTWEVWTYDVWGNAKDGYDVNDRFCHERSHEITCPIDVNNAGTPAQFESAYPSDKQLRAAFGIRCQFETDGDDTIIYLRRSRDGYPIGELLCTSYSSLSPIRKKE